MNPREPEMEALQAAAEHIHGAGIVAYPTDTLYGLAVDPRNAKAVASLFALKSRAVDAAIPLIAADLDQIERDAGVMSPLARRLAAGFWPGPLALVIDALPAIAVAVHAGSGTIAVRVPAHPVARALAAAAGHVITATSANRSGRPPARTADEAADAIGGTAALLLDAGPLPESAPSTIVDARDLRPVLLRAGAVPWDRVLEFLTS